ncbi:MAG: Cardiolipin synthase [Chlamydiae bacterium]|nr:Cardiolipin synthase [Chlamydiota bacterium]
MTLATQPMSYASACKMHIYTPALAETLLHRSKPILRKTEPCSSYKAQISPLKQGAKATVEYLHSGKSKALKESLIKSIGQANKSIEIYTYTFLSKKIAKELNKKAKLGVKVTLHIDVAQTAKLSSLLSSKVKVITHDCKSGLFHHKTMIVDQEKVWMGSGNFTSASYDHQFNLFEKIYSKNLAKKITEIFSQKKASAYIIKEKIGMQKVEYWHLPASETQVNTGKARQNVKALKRLISLIDGANKTIKVANACFSNKKLANALIRASNRGVDVQFFYNPKNANQSSMEILEKLKSAGVKLIPNAHLREHHLKFMICDDQTMINGSPNWSSSSFSRNDESFLVVESQTKEQKKAMRSLWKSLVG